MLVSLVVFGCMLVLYVYDTPVYLNVLRDIGIWPWGHPFIDGEFMFAMKRCWLQGADIYQAVPCDAVPGNKMAYSPLWPRLPLPTDNAARVPVGLATDLLLLLSIAILPPARTLRSAGLLSLAVVSTMVFFALERNNIDVWIYLLIVAGTLLFIRGGAVRVAAYAVFMLAGLLKYYPFILFGLALKERPTRFWLIAVLSLLGLAGFVAVFRDEILKELPNVPGGSPFADMVGIVNVPRALALLLSAHLGALPPRGEAAVELVLRLLLTAQLTVWALTLAGRPGFVAAIARLRESDAVWLLTGCLVMGGCYLLGQSVGYRGIYLLIVLSGLLALRRQCDAPATRPRLTRAVLAILPLMWMEGIRLWGAMAVRRLGAPEVLRNLTDVGLWLVRELLWLDLASVLLAVLFVSAARSATGLAAIDWMRRHALAVRR